MNIRFQGNFQVFGPKKASVSRELSRQEAQSAQLSLGVVTPVSCGKGQACNPNHKFGGFLVTDEDAVEFLKERGLERLDLERDKAVVQQEADDFVAQKFQLRTPAGLQQFSQELAQFAYLLRFVYDKITEKDLTK